MNNSLEVPVREMARKVCTKCKESKLLDSFHRNSRMGDGLQTICKQCTADYAKEYQRRQKARKYYQDKKAGVIAKPPFISDRKQRKMTMVLNDDCAYLTYSHPLSANDFNIILRTIGLNEKLITGQDEK